MNCRLTTQTDLSCAVGRDRDSIMYAVSLLLPAAFDLTVQTLVTGLGISQFFAENRRNNKVIFSR